ncbi:hypothetical protein R1flu_027093 [Riccia fluitans]|uniref:Uncharacterized protein n=1 Tax=Riccia fluitans TaxID=41844 RepID=A0ABD1XHY1_9MARC
MDSLSLVPNSQILLVDQSGSEPRHENQMLNTLQMAGLQDPSIQQAGLLDNRIPNPAQGTLQALILQDGRTHHWPALSQGHLTTVQVDLPVPGSEDAMQLCPMGPGGSSFPQGMRQAGVALLTREYPMRIVGSPEAVRQESYQRRDVTTSAGLAPIPTNLPSLQTGV